MPSFPAPAAFEAPLSPLTMRMRRPGWPVVGRPGELAAIRRELAVARAGQIAALTLEGEPGIGKTRLLVAAAELAAAEGFAVAAVTADEEIRGPFLLARAILVCAGAEAGAAGQAQEELQRAVAAVTGRDDPGFDGLSPDHRLLRTFDLAAVALRALAATRPLALLVDDLQWADEDSLRLLRYLVRAGADAPMFLVLALRPEETALVTEATTLAADMERMGMLRRMRLARFTQAEAADLLSHLLAGKVHPGSAAILHAQAEGVPYILEEVARAYRDAGMIQQIDGVWSLARNAERLVPASVRTLVERRAARVPEPTRALLAEAAILGRSFSLKDLRVVKLHLGEDEARASVTSLAETLAPATAAGLLLELPPGSVADYSFTHEQVRGAAAAALTGARRRSIHGAVVDVIVAGGDPDTASLPLLAHHAMAAGDTERAARFSIDAARAALDARAPEEALRMVENALRIAAAAPQRLALLTARDDAFEMLRRPADRLEGLAELSALAEALRDPHLELEIMLRRASALRLSGDEDRAAALAGQVRRLAAERGDLRAELAACLELGQSLLRRPLGESFGAPTGEIDHVGAEDAYARAAELATRLGEVRPLAAATRELGVIDVARARAWFVGLMQRGEHRGIVERIAAGEDPGVVLADRPVAPLIASARARFERAAELFEQAGDRRGVMSAIIAMAYISFGLEIHLRGSARRIEEIRRLATRMRSLTSQSEGAAAEAQMLYGAHVFARAKVVPDLALWRGDDAHREARVVGDRSLEFAAAGGMALTHLDLGEVPEAERWLDRAAAAAAAAPTPLRARQLALWRGMARAAAGDAEGMRSHLEAAVRLAAEQGRPASRCEALARLALESARLGAERGEAELLALADRSAGEALALAGSLPGRPPWAAQAEAARARAALARGDVSAAAASGQAALDALRAIETEDVHLEILLPAGRAVLAGGSDAEREAVRELLRWTLTAVAQRTIDEQVRVRWFRSPTGSELSELAGAGMPDGPERRTARGELAPEETELLWLLIEGRTNREIARELGIAEEVVVQRLAGVYARLGASSRAEAAALAFREGVV